MKRHEKLIPYSRFHRKILFLALISKSNAPDVKGYPTKINDKIDFAIAFYKDELYEHFEDEKSNLLEVYKGIDHKLDLLINDLIQERKEIKLLFSHLSEKRKESILNKLGESLEKHVRKEEREFFELLQKKVLNNPR